jgi:hypothetical protein
MSLAEVAVLIVLILGVGVSVLALLLLGWLIFPRIVARSRWNAEQMPRRSLLIGTINLLFFGVLAAGLGDSNEVARLLALLIIVLMLSFMALGLTALAQIVGERLGLAHYGPLRRMLLGGLLLQGAALTPIVGWFGVAPLTLLIGYGAAIIAFFQRQQNLDP